MIGLVLLVALCCGATGLVGAWAQTSGPRRAETSSPAPGAPVSSVQDVNEERARREEEFRATQESLSRSAESRERLEREIAEIKGDRAKLNGALVEAAAGVQATEGRIGAVEDRLSTLSASETALRGSLEARRGLIVEILAALQRMGRKPPPAVLVRSEDVLSAIRTSMLLGAVLPELKGEADALAGDLAELVRLKGLIGGEREALGRELAGLGAERERLNALIAARQSRIGEVEQTVAGERQRAAELGTKAKTLKELLDRLESDIVSAQRAAEEAKRTEDAKARETRERFAAAAFRDPARLAPSTPFAEARGQLPVPINGKVLRAFGSGDGFGSTARGISIAARPGAVVSAPADGWVAFSGPFRSFGRLLIMNAGGGYYLLLAGMDRITVDVGQFVLAGEPVATMGDTSSLSPATGTLETNDPVLYVEFRKDGGPIDPGPWWAKSQGEKVRG